jgi:hypothetical protein
MSDSHRIRRSALGLFGLISLVLAAPGCRSEREEAAQDLLNAFASGCDSQGDWTQAALAQTRALQTTIENLKNDDSCSGLSSALGSVQSLSSELQRLSSDANLVAEKQAEENKRQLLLALQEATDPELIPLLKAELATSEIALAAARAATFATSGTESSTQLVNGLTQVTGYLSTLMSTSTQLGSCLRDHPALGVQLGTGALAIAGTFVNPAVGVALSSAGQILSGVVDFARRERLDRAIDEVQSVRMEAALACGLESMAQTYCDAQDVYRLARIQAESYSGAANPNRFWKGLDLWSNRVPKLMNWISKIAAGVSPADSITADRQNNAWRQVNALQSNLRVVEGLVSETERLLSTPQDGATGANWQEIVTRSALKRMLDAMYGEARFFPIAQFYSTRTALLYKVVLDTKPPSNSTEWRNEDTIELPPRGFQEITARARAIFADIGKQLLAQLQLVVDVDPSGLLREATQPDTVGSFAPVEVMRDLLSFLDESAQFFGAQSDPESQNLLPLIRETQSILADVLALVMTAPGTQSGDRDIIALIFEKLNLLYGTEFISGRFYRHIQWDVNARVEAGELPDDISELMRLSGRDAARELLGVGRNGLDELVQDIGTAQAVSQRNVENFVSFFQGGLAGALERLEEAAQRAGEPETGPLRPNRMLKARICTLMLTTATEWPKKVKKELCQGVTLESVYPALADIKLDFNTMERELRGKPLANRMCTYRNFLRQGRLLMKKPGLSFSEVNAMIEGAL